MIVFLYKKISFGRKAGGVFLKKIKTLKNNVFSGQGDFPCVLFFRAPLPKIFLPLIKTALKKERLTSLSLRPP